MYYNANVTLPDELTQLGSAYFSGGKLDPKGKATRAQVAQMFLNAKNVLTSTQLLPQEERPDPEY